MNNSHHLVGLSGQFHAGRSGFLRTGRHGLCHLVHLCHRIVDLANSLRLFARCGRNPQYVLGHRTATGINFLNPFGDLLNHIRSDIGLLDTGADQVGGALGGLGGTLGQVAHFLGHDGKPLALFSARAASTAAFKARQIGWKAISSMVLIMPKI